jgi:DNA uptake protein ComE-like DNA-binding protein
MGSTNSCFPSSFDPLHTLRRRTKIKHDQTGLTIPKYINNNNTINLNDVSEDELLMLPGINRQIAQNILQYRQLNHGFKQIDELLLINGINHDLFQRIHSDICINSSSSSQYLSNNKQELLNLNLATYDQLCLINGLTSILATRIIQRRERKGPYRFVEDLLKIKGIDYIVLANIRSYITVDYHQIPLSISESSIVEQSINNLYPTLNKNNNNNTDSLSLASLLLETLPPELQTILLSSPPQRPSPISKPKQTYFRFVSWNLQQLTNDKVQNSGVREVICRIILENK